MSVTKNESGFTLMELLLVVTITTAVGILLVSILVQNSGLFYQQNSRISQGVGENDALSSFRENAKVAKAVAISYPETGSAQYTSGPSQLVLKLAAIDSQSNVITGVFDFVVYYVTANRLYVKIFPGSGSTRQPINQILSNNVNSVTFSYLDQTAQPVTPTSATKVRMMLTLAQKAGKAFETDVATSEADLRND